MQLSIGSGYHIGKSKLRIPKEALSRFRYESNTTKRSPKTIVERAIVILEPKGHVIPLASHGRNRLINKTVADTRTGEQCVVSRVRVAVDSGKRGISAVCPRW